MRIGFDVSQTGKDKAGCGYYAHALAHSLARMAGVEHRLALYPSFGDFYFDPGMPRRSPIRGAGLTYGPHHSTRDSAAAFWNARDLEGLLGNPDIVHSNNFWCPVGLRSARLVYTLYDLAFLVEPAWTTEENRLGCFEGVFRASLVADWIVAISTASRDDFLRFFPHFPADRIRVIHPCTRFDAHVGAGRMPEALRSAAPGRFWLSVGTIEPRKNHRLLAQAYASYCARSRNPMPLVLAGGKGWLMDDFVGQLEALGLRDRIVLTGYVSDEELVWLYRNCYANLYPSLFEGFGLPVLEGMTFGAATMSSNATSLPEVAGDAAVLLPPHDVDAWSDAMCRLDDDPAQQRRLRELAARQAARFSWRDSASQLLQLYEEAVSRPKRGGSIE